ADASVQDTQVFGNRGDGAFALRKSPVQLLFLFRVLRMHFFALGGDGLFGGFQRAFCIFDAALGIFSAHHDFQLAVFGFGDFGFGVGDFVLERLVSFVAFYGAALFAVFLGAIFPLLDVQLELFAFREAVSVGFAGGGDGV